MPMGPTKEVWKAGAGPHSQGTVRQSTIKLKWKNLRIKYYKKNSGCPNVQGRGALHRTNQFPQQGIKAFEIVFKNKFVFLTIKACFGKTSHQPSYELKINIPRL